MTAQKNINSADTKLWPVTAAREGAAKYFDKKEKEQNEEIFQAQKGKNTAVANCPETPTKDEKCSAQRKKDEKHHSAGKLKTQDEPSKTDRSIPSDKENDKKPKKTKAELYAEPSQIHWRKNDDTRSEQSSTHNYASSPSKNETW